MPVTQDPGLKTDYMPHKIKQTDFHLPKLFTGLKRGPQAMLPKDIGLVIAYSGIGKESTVVDAGAGSAYLALALANVAKQVYTYEIREDFFKLAAYNIKKSCFLNIELISGDIIQGIRQEPGTIDLVTLDMPNADLAVRHAFNCLKTGGYCLGFMPHVEQVAKFAAECRACGFTDIFTLESIVREMLVREQGIRPTGTGLTHTGYLVFARK